MSKRILVFSSMNGGAETVAPVAKKLIAQGHDVRIISYRAATATFRNMGLEPDKILSDNTYLIEAANKIVTFRPDAIITGTQIQERGYTHVLEHEVWLIARKEGIKTICVQDTWGNYAERYSDLDVESTNRVSIATGGKFKYMPDIIAIIDELAKKEMLAIGFPSDMLVITGNPYFEHVITEAEKLSPTTRAELLAKPVFSHFYKDAKLIVFMSDTLDPYQDIGYTEKSVLQSFLRVVDGLAKEMGMRINVIVRPHPFRNADALGAYSCNTPNIAKVLHNPVTAKGTDPANDYSMEQLLKSVDLVAGTFNNPLITAKLMGRPTLSYQPNANPEYTFQEHWHRNGMIAKVTEENDLAQMILYLLNGIITQKSLEASRGAIDRVIGLI